MLHPKLQIQVEYQLEGTYFAMHMHGMYATIPKESDIKLCMMSQGHLCMFDEPLYPVEKIHLPLLYLHLHQEPTDVCWNLSQRLPRNYMPKDNYVLNPMLDI